MLGITGLCETVLGLAIVFLAGTLQRYLATGIVPEPLNLRILGMMDFNIGLWYLLIAANPEKYVVLNRVTCFLRLGLSVLFLVEGTWLLQDWPLRLMYQFLAVFDFFLFAIQGLYLRHMTQPAR
ncbi:MAG: hypothetical protein JNN08_14590 [Bryobacterales bacterium]|nr:hypothetical protein [Bryobacterales bacterium]